MQYYSQKNSRWANQKLGTCQDTFAQSSCLVTCLAMFAEKTPLEVNQLLLQNGGYKNGCLVISEKAANILNLEYQGKSWARPSNDCIAETHFYLPQGIPQHFFIYLSDGKIIDPLDNQPQPKTNPYNIASYRLFKPLKPKPMSNSAPHFDGKEVQKLYLSLWNEKMTLNQANVVADEYKEHGHVLVTKLLQHERYQQYRDQIDRRFRERSECIVEKNKYEDQIKRIKQIIE